MNDDERDINRLTGRLQLLADAVPKSAATRSERYYLIRFVLAVMAVVAQTTVSLLGVTVLPDAWWAVALVVGSAVAALAVIVWSQR